MTQRKMRAGQTVGSVTWLDTLTGSDDILFSGNASSTLPASWSWEQQGGSIYNDEYGQGNIQFDSSAFNYVRGIYRSLPGSFVSCTVRFSCVMTATNGNQGPGLYLRNSSSGKIAHFTLRGQNTTNLTYFSAASSGTVGTDNQASHAVSGLMSNVYMRIVKNSSTSWDFCVGPSAGMCNAYFAAQNVTTATQGFTPDQIGFGFLCIPNTVREVAIDGIKFT